MKNSARSRTNGAGMPSGVQTPSLLSTSPGSSRPCQRETLRASELVTQKFGHTFAQIEIALHLIVQEWIARRYHLDGEEEIAAFIWITRPHSPCEPNDQNVRLHAIAPVITTPHVGRRDQCLPDPVSFEILDQAHVQRAHDELMHFSGRGRHEQFPVDDLMAPPVVGEGIEHVNGPIVRCCWHTHTIDHSAKGGQVGIAWVGAGPSPDRHPLSAGWS